jgi:hypothetical protein
VWRSTIDGRRLTFHLAGINNQNFIMRDDETGSWWQQVTGEAINGPLAGRALEPVTTDEVSFAIWRGEHARGRVLAPDDSAPWRRFSENWEAQTAKLPVLTAPATGELAPRETVVGVKLADAARAYPLARVAESGAVVDAVGGVPVAVIVAPDGASFRVFDRRLDGAAVELFRDASGRADTYLDATTGSRFDFAGRGVEGPLAGRQLVRVPAFKDYWFDWKTYNPGTTVYDPSRPGA